MKKRTMVLGGLIAAVAITGYSVSGTYAKYISEVGVTDQARVAQWFLNEENDAALFGEMYGADGKIVEAASSAIVKSSINNTISNVIAPGTKGEYAFKLSGTSEVNYELSSVISANNTVKYPVTNTDDISGLSSKNLLDATNCYSPLRFKLYEGENSASGTLVTLAEVNGRTDTLEAVVKYLGDEVYGASGTVKKYEAGAAALKAYTITWEWAYTNIPEEKHNTMNGQLLNGPAIEEAKLISKYDTKLAQAAVTDSSNYTVSLSAKITAQQIDDEVVNP